MSNITLTLPEEQSFLLPSDPYDLRCIKCDMAETSKDKHPMLAFEYEIVAPLTKKLAGRDAPTDVAGIKVRDWIVLYDKAIAELEAKEDSLSDEEKKTLDKYRYIKTNKVFGTLVKLGAVHTSLGLPLDIDLENLDTSIYLGQTCCAQLRSEAKERRDSEKNEPILGIDGKPLMNYNLKIERFLGPARHPEMHPSF